MKVRVILGLLLAVCAWAPAIAVAQCQGGHQQQQFEVNWLKSMIDHHQMAVLMSGLVETRATHQELKDLAVTIKTSQEAEIIQMQAWLQAWYGVTYEPQIRPRDQYVLDRLEALGGAEFEIAWLREMIRHHAMAVMHANMAIRRATHPELKALAESIVAVQVPEIVLMRLWLQQWYGFKG